MQVFSTTWFDKHQSKLIWFANTKIGRKILYINKKTSDVGNRRIVRIAPNSITWALKVGKKKLKLQTEFRTHDRFAKRLYHAFYPFWATIHFFDWLVLDRFEWAKPYSFGFNTLTVYPDSGSGSTTVDGYVERSGVAQTFANIIAGAGTGSGVSISNGPTLISDTVFNQYTTLVRTIATFDTSALTAGATISAATLSVWGAAVANALGDDDFHICSSTPASNNALVNADYGQLGATSFGSVVYASYVTSAYNNITLNASGITNISKTGISKFGTRLGWDINSSFGGTWVTGNFTYFTYFDADVAGTTTDPKLVVTYTVASSGSTLLTNYYYISR